MDLSWLSSFLPEMSAKLTVLLHEYYLHSKPIHASHFNITN